MVSKQPISRFIVVITALCALLATPASFAQIYATVSKNRLTQNELFQLRIVSDKKVSGNQLDLSVLDNDFQILGRPSFGTSLNIINGTRTTRSEWNINIAAKHTGVITLPAFTIDGESSQPIALQVVKDATLPNNQDLVSITTHFDELTLYPKQSTIMHVELVIKADARGLQIHKLHHLRHKVYNWNQPRNPFRASKLLTVFKALSSNRTFASPL